MATFVGGMRWPAGRGTFGGDATAPFVRLRIDGAGVHLAPYGRLAWFLAKLFLMPSYAFSWADIQLTERLKRGVRFVVSPLEAPVIFWTADPDRVLDAVAAHGSVVARQSHPVYGRPRLHRGPLTRRKLVGVGSAVFTVIFANIVWAIAGLPATVTTPLRVLVLIVCVLYILVAVLIPDDYWTRGR